jgi:hypothetical protein
MMGKFKMVYRSTIFLSGGKLYTKESLKKCFKAFYNSSGGGR